ncbi:MAG: ATP-binding protein [Muribaculum sp.]|nr:ATP-binding protein [Muribaculum sp.]
MGLIKKSNELTIPSTVKMMVYGQPGTGKTTFALSAPKPLLLDFDNGVKRVNMAHLEGIDIVQVENWGEIQQLLQQNVAELAPYQTIVVDTIGKMMDFVIAYCCGTRQPQIKDWGRINQEFTWFTRALSMLNKHIVFVAHRDSRKEGEETVFIPALREKNYNSIVTELDLLGYLEMKSERGVQMRTITFDPTSRNDGKNTCNLPSSMGVPVILNAQAQPTAPNNFITEKILNPYLSMLEVKAEERRKYDELLDTIAEDVNNITDAFSANDFAERIKEYPHVGSSMAKARALFGAKVKELKLVYNSDTKTYDDAESV